MKFLIVSLVVVSTITATAPYPIYWDGKPAGMIPKEDLDKMTPPKPERGEKPE